MEASCLLQNRKDLVKLLEGCLNEKAVYLGAPSFAFKIGPYTVTKDGTLTADEYDTEFITELSMKGIIEGAACNEGSTTIYIPMSDHSGPSLMNIVFRINSKDELLSKVCGRKGAFRISRSFVSKLDTARPKTVDEFMGILKSCGGNEINSGIVFTDDKILFTAFPFSKQPEIIEAYRKLAEHICEEALSKGRVRPERIGLTENEKYSFRNWLVSIGMTGSEYKAARAILLRNLSGHTAFRTKKQAEYQTKKWTEIRKESREQECSAFHVL